MQERTLTYSKNIKMNESSGEIVRKIKHTITSPSRIKQFIIRLVMYVLLFDLTYVYIFPFLYMIVTALKSNADLNDLSVNWIPRSLKYQNFQIAYQLLGYNRYLKNSVIITFFATLGHMLGCSFIGYGFARYNFPLKRVLFLLVIISFIVPVQTIIVPLYITYKNFNWLNTFLPLIVPTFFGFGLKGSLFIFLFRQMYLGLPTDLEQAAKIDGCNFMMTYWRIVVPIARSSFLVTLVLSLVWHWNDFYEPAIYISKSSMTVLPSRINYLSSIVNAPPDQLFDMLQNAASELPEGEESLNNAVMMAGTFLIIMPVLVIFSIVQKQFMQGIETTGLKE